MNHIARTYNHENHKAQAPIMVIISYSLKLSKKKCKSEILISVRVASLDFYMDIINNCSCLITNLQYPVLVDVIRTPDAQIHRGGHGGLDLLENNNY